MSETPGGFDCNQALDRLFLFIDNEMDPLDCVQLRDHLERCPPCLEQYRLDCTVKSLVSHACCEHAPPQLRNRVLGSIRHFQPPSSDPGRLPHDFR